MRFGRRRPREVPEPPIDSALSATAVQDTERNRASQPRVTFAQALADNHSRAPIVCLRNLLRAGAPHPLSGRGLAV